MYACARTASHALCLLRSGTGQHGARALLQRLEALRLDFDGHPLAQALLNAERQQTGHLLVAADGRGGEGAVTPACLASWVCSAASRRLLEEIINTTWDPQAASQEERCRSAVAHAIVAQWCNPDLLDLIKRELEGETQTPPLPAPWEDWGVQPWSMTLTKAGVAVADYCTQQGESRASKLKAVLEGQHGMSFFDLPKIHSHAVELDWPCIFATYRAAQRAGPSNPPAAAPAPAFMPVTPAQSTVLPITTPLPSPLRFGASPQVLAPALHDRPAEPLHVHRRQQQPQHQHHHHQRQQHAQQDPLLRLPPLPMDRVRAALIAACGQSGVCANLAEQRRQALVKNATSRALLYGFCRSLKAHAYKGMVVAKDLAAYDIAVASLASGVDDLLHEHPAFAGPARPSSGMIQVLLGGEEASAEDTVPFILTLHGGSWRIRFNVRWIWEQQGHRVSAAPAAAAPVPSPAARAAAPAAAASPATAPAAGPPETAAAAAAAVAAVGEAPAAKPALGPMAAPRSGVGHRAAAMQQGSSSSIAGDTVAAAEAAAPQPLGVLLSNVERLLPLSVSMDKKPLVCHLAAKVLLEGFGESVLSVLRNLQLPAAPQQQGGQREVMEQLQVSQELLTAFSLPMEAIGAQIQAKLRAPPWSQYVQAAGPSPTAGLSNLLAFSFSSLCQEPAWGSGHKLFWTRAQAVGLLSEWLWPSPSLVSGADQGGSGMGGSSGSNAGSSCGSRGHTLRANGNASSSTGRPLSPCPVQQPPHQQPQPSQARFAGLDLSSRQAAEMAALPAASHASLQHAVAAVCSRNLHCEDEHQRGGAEAAATPRQRELLQACADVVLGGYVKTHVGSKGGDVEATALAKYAPSTMAVGDLVTQRMCTRYPDLAGSDLYPALREALQAHLWRVRQGAERALFALHFVNYCQRITLDVRRLWDGLELGRQQDHSSAARDRGGGSQAAGGQRVAAAAATAAAAGAEGRDLGAEPRAEVEVASASAAAEDNWVEMYEDATATGFVVHPPYGYDTVVSDSGGLLPLQRQAAHDSSDGAAAAKTDRSSPAAAAEKIPMTFVQVAEKTSATGKASALGSAGYVGSQAGPAAADSGGAGSGREGVECVSSNGSVSISGGGGGTAPSSFSAALSLEDGLPFMWASASQLMAALPLLCEVVDLVWPHVPGARTAAALRIFLCNHVAKAAVDTGIQFHLSEMHGGPVPNEASAFLVMLDMAGTAAVDDWSKGAAGNEGLEGAQPRGPLHVGSLVEAHERQLRPRAPLLRVETAQMGGEGEERGVGGSTPVVRLDVVGLLDLAASIRLADELALMM